MVWNMPYQLDHELKKKITLGICEMSKNDREKNQHTGYIVYTVTSANLYLSDSYVS